MHPGQHDVRLRGWRAGFPPSGDERVASIHGHDAIAAQTNEACAQCHEWSDQSTGAVESLADQIDVEQRVRAVPNDEPPVGRRLVSDVGIGIIGAGAGHQHRAEHRIEHERQRGGGHESSRQHECDFIRVGARSGVHAAHGAGTAPASGIDTEHAPQFHAADRRIDKANQLRDDLGERQIGPDLQAHDEISVARREVGKDETLFQAVGTHVVALATDLAVVHDGIGGGERAHRQDPGFDAAATDAAEAKVQRAGAR